MNLSSIKEQILETIRTRWAEFQETTLFNNMKERYDSLNPRAQKGVQVAGLLLGLYVVFNIPYSFFSSSQSKVNEYSDNVRLLRDLFRVQRDLAQTPDSTSAPDGVQLQGQVNSILKSAGLAVEQIKGVNSVSGKPAGEGALLPSGISESGVEVILSKLTIKQVMDLSVQIRNISPNLHVTNFDLRAMADNDHFYDMTTKIVGFSVDEPPKAEPKTSEKSSGKSETKDGEDSK